MEHTDRIIDAGHRLVVKGTMRTDLGFNVMVGASSIEEHVCEAFPELLFSNDDPRIPVRITVERMEETE